MKETFIDAGNEWSHQYSISKHVRHSLGSVKRKVYGNQCPFQGTREVTCKWANLTSEGTIKKQQNKGKINGKKIKCK